MTIDSEKAITKLWRNLHSTQNEIGKTYYRWRQVALSVAREDITSEDIAKKAATVFGKDIGKSLLPRLNWLKGEEGFLMTLGKALTGIWLTDGGVARVEGGDTKGEVILKCSRDPWPTWAKQYGVPMEEVALYQEYMFQAILEDVSVFFNIPLRIEMLKAIPRGEGETVMRLYKDETI